MKLYSAVWKTRLTIAEKLYLIFLLIWDPTQSQIKQYWIKLLHFVLWNFLQLTALISRSDLFVWTFCFCVFVLFSLLHSSLINALRNLCSSFVNLSIKSRGTHKSYKEHNKNNMYIYISNYSRSNKIYKKYIILHTVWNRKSILIRYTFFFF